MTKRNTDLDNNKQNIISKFNNGETIKSISKELNENPSLLRRRLKEWGIDTSKNKYSFKRRSGDNHPQWTGYKEISGDLWKNIKRNAKDRNLEFTITKEYVWQIFLEQDKRCAISDLPIKFSNGYSIKDRTASLDRIKSNLGYIEGNVQWVHKNINQIKWDFEESKLFYYCDKISNFQEIKRRLGKWLKFRKKPYWLT